MTLTEALADIKARNLIVLDVKPLSMRRARLFLTVTPGAPWVSVDVDARLNAARLALGLPRIPTLLSTILRYTALSWLSRQVAAWKGRRAYRAFQRRQAKLKRNIDLMGISR